MDYSTTAVAESAMAATASPVKASKCEHNDSQTNLSSSYYDSALDDTPLLSLYDPFEENVGDISKTISQTEVSINSTTDLNNITATTPSAGTAASDINNCIFTSSTEQDQSNIADNKSSMELFAHATPNLIASQQSESTETNTSQEEVDPKSQLANKTVFKSKKPPSSIIEIRDNSIKEQELENVVVLIDSDDEQAAQEQLKNLLKKSPIKSATVTDASSAVDTSAGSVSQLSCGTNTNSMYCDALTLFSSSSIDVKRRKKPESLIHTSKQKLNIDIAEASAAADSSYIDIPSLDSSELNGNLFPVEVTESAESQLPQQQEQLQQQQEQLQQQQETKRDIKIYDTLEEFENNLPSTVQLLDTPFGSKVYLVGTAHFSEESQDDVSLVIRNVRPDVVMVELCPSRIHILKLDEKTLLEEAKNFTIAKIRGIIQAHGYINGIFFIMLLQMSAQVAKDLGMAPGGEFRRAFEEVHKLPGCILHLGDRPIRITLHRALRALSLWQTLKLVWHLTSSDTISIAEVEECKQRDLLEKLMRDMAGEFPAFSDVFVKERDLYLCHSLQLAALPQALHSTQGARPVRVVGVVGIGHAKGIAKMWGQVDPQKIPGILEIPPPSLSTRICAYTLQYGAIAFTVYMTFKFLRPRIKSLF